MSERRSARGAASAGRAVRIGNELPPEMAMGPCMEVWANPVDPQSLHPWMQAMRAWGNAVDDWAERTGWATERRPAMNARNLARTRHPWSRDYLSKIRALDYLDWLEGRRSDNPGPPGPPHKPLY